MDNQTLINLVRQLPQTRQVSADEAYWSKTVASVLPLVLNEMFTAHDWDFTLGEYADVTTVANQAEYVIYGAKYDCRDVINIRYGSDKINLTYYPVLEMDEIISNGQLSTGVVAWTYAPRNDEGYPVITLHNTPAAAGEVLSVRYRKMAVRLEALSDDFGYVIACGVVAWVVPQLRYVFEKEMKKAIRRYRRGGRDVNRTAISAQAVRSNNDIVDLYGTG